MASLADNPLANAVSAELLRAHIHGVRHDEPRQRPTETIALVNRHISTANLDQVVGGEIGTRQLVRPAMSVNRLTAASGRNSLRSAPCRCDKS